jgi:methylated-DNA-[protein]-cysteine S-methyltransferase
MTTWHTTMTTPIGELLLVKGPAGLRGVYMGGHEHVHVHEHEHVYGPDMFGREVAQLEEYFAGRRTGFELELDLQGTPFQLRVWRALSTIPFGETVSYGAIARSLGMPRASRAVGAANAHNPLSIVVPCHRVIGADGSLTGYAGGKARKQWLLAHEERVLTRGAHPQAAQATYATPVAS